ncbi:hypothetical protein [Nocardioides panacisoli]|uniref:Outer membrane channel protein CpnT-like N-terminal domain-containing protein n=1 Tax=Nocardioides panacisoli TaxID=627624 RepID=A0ABP7J3D4_9ACTN
MNMVAVDGGGYTAACDSLYDGNHAVFNALDALSDALAGSASMAGGDQCGAEWAKGYDQAAPQLVDAARQLADGFAKAANLTNTSLSNHDAADGGSTLDENRYYTGPPDDPDPAHYTENLYFTVPSATGGGTDEPSWWHWLASHMEGWFWPSADTDRMRAVGAAWRTCGGSVQLAGSYATSASSSLSIEQSPEIGLATKSLEALDSHCNDIGSAMIDLGNACDDYARLVDEKHQEIEDELTSFLEWTAGIQVVGGIISIFTAGVAEAPTQAVEAAEVANAASKVVNVIKGLFTAVKGLETVAALLERIKTPLAALGRLLGGEREIVAVERAAAEAERTALLDELEANGIKFSKDSVVSVFHDADGKIVFLEQGNERAGLQHILSHADDFAKAGVPKEDIPDLLRAALSEGKVVGTQGRDRPIYEVVVDGVTRRVAITVSKNGFIVGANPA